MSRLRPVLLAVAATCAAVPAAASAAPRIETFAPRIDNPRGLALAPDGTLYVASAGHGGPACLDPKGETCLGLSSSVLAVAADGTRRVVGRGMLSGSGRDGTFATGADGVGVAPDGRGGLLVADGSVLAVTTSATPREIAAAPGRFRRAAGKLWRLGLGAPQPLAAIDAYEWAHNTDATKGDRNSNPYAVLPLADRTLVADAGANVVLSVAPDATISPLFVLPKIKGQQAVPSSLALGPDGAAYVGELALGAGKGGASVWRVPLDGSAPTKAMTGLTAVTGIAFGPDGSLYVTELTTEPREEGSLTGAIVRRAPDGTRTPLRRSTLLAPQGMVVAPDGALYVSNRSVLPARTPARGPFHGMGGEVVRTTGF